MPPPRQDDLDRLAERVDVLERIARAPYRETRDPEGRLRVRLGLQEDGRYGLRVWSAGGVLTIDQTV